MPAFPTTIDIQPHRIYSPDFDDVYFSQEDGMAETMHVFIHGNDLTQRIQHPKTFTIGETGFGTGLNFLTTYQHFMTHAHPQAKLRYISVEKFPLSRSQLQQCLAFWPSLSNLTDQLINKYPTAPLDINHFTFHEEKLDFSLFFSDAISMLREFTESKIDAWFLDGFAPDRNPDMWSTPLCHEIFRLTKPGGTFATYTVASSARNHLRQAGFTIEKTPGFGRKRHMLKGVKHG